MVLTSRSSGQVLWFSGGLCLGPLQTLNPQGLFHQMQEPKDVKSKVSPWL